MVLRVERSRVELNRTRKMLERLVRLAELSTNVPETIVSGGKIGRSLQRTFVRLGRTGEILRAFFRLSEFEERLRRRTVALRPRGPLLRGSGDAQRADEEHARCTRRTAEHSRILAPASGARSRRFGVSGEHGTSAHHGDTKTRISEDQALRDSASLTLHHRPETNRRKREGVNFVFSPSPVLLFDSCTSRDHKSLC